jgi:hypothetical protein
MHNPARATGHLPPAVTTSSISPKRSHAHHYWTGQVSLGEMIWGSTLSPFKMRSTRGVLPLMRGREWAGRMCDRLKFSPPQPAYVDACHEWAHKTPDGRLLALTTGANPNKTLRGGPNRGGPDDGRAAHPTRQSHLPALMPKSSTLIAEACRGRRKSAAITMGSPANERNKEPGRDR